MFNEPYAYAVYFPDQPKIELVHDLQELMDDLTNREHEVLPLHTEDEVNRLLEDAEKSFWLACSAFGKVGELVYESYRIRKENGAKDIHDV